MELIFNELSGNPLSSDVNNAKIKMATIIKTLGKSNEKGFRKIRSSHYSNEIQLSEGYSMHDWLSDQTVSKTYRDIIAGSIIHPFIKEDDELMEDQYLKNQYWFEDKDYQIKRIECYGLASAHLYQTLSISFSGFPLWEMTKLNLILQSEETEEIVEINNVSSPASFEDVRISNFIDNIKELELIESEIEPKNKEVHISTHHGKKELKEFSEKLKCSPYVEIIRSTDWGGNNFIRRFNKVGEIEIVLTDTIRKYALWVKTTGRNYRETEAIAKLLRDKYDR